MLGIPTAGAPAVPFTESLKHLTPPPGVEALERTIVTGNYIPAERDLLLEREIAEAGDFTLLCVVVVTPGAEEMSMNLMAPIVVNLKTRRARQVVLDGSNYSVKEPIPRKAADPA